MNHEIRNISFFDEAPETGRLAELKQKYNGKTEFTVPVNYFEDQLKTIPAIIHLESLKITSSIDDIRIPDNEMADLTARILTTSDSTNQQVDDDFFEFQKRSILAKIELSDSLRDNNMNESFFEQQRIQIMRAVESDRKIISIRKWRKNLIICTSAAAVLLIAFLFFNPGKSSTGETASFATALENTPLDDEDLKYILEGDEYESFLIETGMTDDEHKAIDSLIVSATVSPHQNEIGIQPETTESVNTKKEIKPDEAKTTPGWDDLSEEEILEYLYHDADDTELLDELH